MKSLKFDLFGKYAFFKNPESNTGTEFSFEHIHKPAVLGILGCILGLKGKESVTKEDPFPEYYSNLKDLKVSIVPHNPVFNDYKETIINSICFFNDGNNQILDRQILQNVKWTIYLSQGNVEDQYWNKLIQLITAHESSYPLYLGNNSFQAKINNVEIIDLDKFNEDEDVVIDSIFNCNIIKCKNDYTIDDTQIPYDLKVYFPIDINELLLYNYNWLELTNLVLDVVNTDSLYTDNHKVLYFM